MRYLYFIILIQLFSSSCWVKKETTDIENKFTIEQDYKNQNVEIYRSTIHNKKLNGKITRRTIGRYDSTLNFTLIGNFKKGLLNGNDSIFRNGKLIKVDNYIKGVRQGDQLEIIDSNKIISPYVDGIIHGFQKTFINNRIKKSSYFNRGIKDSVEYFYDSLEQVVTTYKYHLDHSDNWESHLNLDRHELISYFGSMDTLDIKLLIRAKYKGTITYYSYDPKGIGDAWSPDVVHESITMDDFLENDQLIHGYFYIIDENSCIVCDYIDHRGIWVAYNNGIELEFYELSAK